jgi:hypothetical protein
MVAAKLVTGRLEFVAQRTVVVDLAVEDDADAPVLVCHRLRTTGEIDDAQAGETQRDVTV